MEVCTKPVFPDEEIESVGDRSIRVYKVGLRLPFGLMIWSASREGEEMKLVSTSAVREDFVNNDDRCSRRF